jgi:hypothetical protein
MSPRCASCTTTPLTDVVNESLLGSGTSSAVRSAGPIGQKLGYCLPRCESITDRLMSSAVPVFAVSKRADTSLTSV